MRIRVNDKFAPYSHCCGTHCLLPLTCFCFTIYPQKIIVERVKQEPPERVAEIELKIKGPIDDFTVQLDLERLQIKVWGKAANGFFRYRIVRQGEAWAFYVEKKPEGAFFSDHPPLIDRTALPKKSTPFEVLSLGVYKNQDVELMQRRCEMRELFPVWYRLSQAVPALPRAYGGACALLRHCEESIAERKLLKLLQSFKNLFKTSFNSLLAPSLYDRMHQGFSLSEPEGSPLWLVSQSGKLIRSMFFDSSSDAAHLLPALPPQLHCGKFLGVKSEFAVFDIEWTKKYLRRMVVYASKSGEYYLHFPKGVKQLRLRSSARDKGLHVKAGEPVAFEKNTKYYLDHFEA